MLVGVLRYPPGDELLCPIEHAPVNFAIPHGVGGKFMRIEIVPVEIPTENVGFHGGNAAYDADLGYALDV